MQLWIHGLDCCRWSAPLCWCRRFSDEHDHSLTDERASFVETKVSAGDYRSSSEVVREALRRMERAEAHETEDVRFLREAWQGGIDSGDVGDMDREALKQDARACLAASKA